MVVQKDNRLVCQKPYKHVKTLRRQNAERAVFFVGTATRASAWSPQGFKALKRPSLCFRRIFTRSGATVCVVRGEFLHVEADGTCNE